jgi:hypothetical protein
MRPSTATQHLMTGRLLSALHDAPVGPMVWTLSPGRWVAQDKELRGVSVFAPGWPLAPSGLP